MMVEVDLVTGVFEESELGWESLSSKIKDHTFSTLPMTEMKEDAPVVLLPHHFYNSITG